MWDVGRGMEHDEKKPLLRAKNTVYSLSRCCCKPTSTHGTRFGAGLLVVVCLQNKHQ